MDDFGLRQIKSQASPYLQHVKGKSVSNDYLQHKYLGCIPSKGNGYVE